MRLKKVSGPVATTSGGDGRFRLLIRLVAVFAGAVSLAAAADSSGVFPYPVTREVLPNGLTVLVIPMSTPGIVSYYSVVRTGSRDEVEPGKSGFAHFFEHMMFRGTKRFPATEYDRIVKKMGATTNAYTTDDHTAYHLTFAKEDLETVMEIESDRFQNLSYSSEVFQTEAGAVYGEYRKNITSPYQLIDEKLREVAFDRHTYRHTTIGFERDIQGMPQQYDYSLDFFRRFYRPDNVVLLIVGDVEPRAVLPLVRKHYAAWKAGYEPPDVPKEPPQAAERSVAISYPGKTLPILTLAYKGDAFAPDARDYVAAFHLMELAFGETSDLRKKLLLQEQKVQTLTTDVPRNRDPSLLEIQTMVKRPEDIGYVRDEILRTLEHFKTQPVDPARLEQLKRRNKYGFILALNDSDAVASQLARYVALAGDTTVVDRFYAALDAVTAEDVMRAAKKYFTPERRTVAVLKGTDS